MGEWQARKLLLGGEKKGTRSPMVLRVDSQCIFFTNRTFQGVGPFEGGSSESITWRGHFLGRLALLHPTLLEGSCRMLVVGLGLDLPL